MEQLTIFLATLFGVLSTTGVIVDKTVENIIREQVAGVEKIAVRIDNSPAYQIVSGQIERVRIATRGLYPIPDLRIEALEVETDEISGSLYSWSQNPDVPLTEALRQPLQGAMRLVITEADVNQALQSKQIQSEIEELLVKIPTKSGKNPTYTLISANFDFMSNNRLQIAVKLLRKAEGNNKEQVLDIFVELGVNIVEGKKLTIIEPVATINNRRVSSRLLKGFAENLSKRLDLDILETEGVIARILQLEITGDKLNLAAFIRLEQ